MIIKVKKTVIIKTFISENFSKGINGNIIKHEKNLNTDNESILEIKLDDTHKENFEIQEKNISVKTYASNSFLEIINKYFEELSQTQEATKELYYRNIKQGLELLKISIESDKKELLMESSIKFIQASTLNKSEPEPYYFLSYIFSIIGNKPTSIKYFDIVKKLKSNYDKELEILRKEIFNKKE